MADYHADARYAEERCPADRDQRPRCAAPHGRRAAHPALALVASLCLALPAVSGTAGPLRASPLPTAHWTMTGSMGHARSSLTLTRLTDGRVLAVGGVVSSTASASTDTGGYTGEASAELYDPRTGRWSPTGALRHARDFATVTLLQDGRVLFTGQADDSDASGAELYDPRSGRWTVTGAMRATRRVPDGAVFSRQAHTATLLRDGRVLVAGGSVGVGVVASAELYDPRSGRWTATAPMYQGREEAAATALPDGRVLVAGGRANNTTFSEAEIYDPRSGRWSVTGSMRDTRYDFSLVALPRGMLLAIGGEGADAAASDALDETLATAEVYDPRTGTWDWTATMHHARRIRRGGAGRGPRPGRGGRHRGLRCGA